MWKIPVAAIGGFLGTLLVLATAREVIFAFQAQPFSAVLNDAISTIGSLRWVDTTLVTGAAAVAAATFSIYWVRLQISSAADDTQRQIDHAASLHKEQVESKRDAARVALPLTLSLICDYATTCARASHDLLPHCKNNKLPRGLSLPEYPEIPQGAVDALRQMVEFIEPEFRPVFAKLASTMQVQRARLRGTARDYAGGFGLSRETILSNIVDALEVYARASAIFGYARFEPDEKPRDIKPGSVASAIYSVGIFSRFEADITEKAGRHDAYVLFGSD
jgi:hypothetical protein